MSGWVRVSDLANQLDAATIGWLGQQTYWTGLDGSAIVDAETVDELIELRRLTEGTAE